MSFLENCRQFVGIESTPNRGNKAVAAFAADLCREMGLHVELQYETLNGLEQCNLIARPQAERPSEEILFQTHLDTVEAGNFATWSATQENPFNATIMDDQIFGLGVADTKLDFLCKLEALKEFVKRPMHTPFVLVGTFGAQNGMAGAIKLVRKKMISARRALIGEPTDLQVMRAGQGLAVVEISIPFSEEEKNYRFQHDLLESSSTQSRIFMGKAAHSSRPHLGENAIVKMLEYLTQLPEGIAVMDLDGGLNYNSVPSSAVLEVDLVGGLRNPIVPKIFEILERAREVESDFSKYPYDLTEPVLPTMNIGMIRTFEDQVRVTGSCRLPPSVPDPVYEKWMSLLNEACVEQGATFRVRDYKKSFATESDSPFLKSVLQIAEKMALNAAPGRIESASEASIFSRLGVECLVFGPGQSVGNSHAPNESIKIEDLKKATEFYKLAAERFCL